MTGEPAPEVLFLCVHNAGRSQMAAELLARSAAGRIVIHSAGSAPGDVLHPAVVAAMAEIGIDISGESPKKADRRHGVPGRRRHHHGCGDACPVYPGTRDEDWEVADPAGLALEEVRAIRDEIARRVDVLASRLLGPGVSS